METTHPSPAACTQTRSLTNSLALSSIQHKGSSSESGRDKWKGTRLTSFWLRAGGPGVGAVLSRDRSPSSCHCYFLAFLSHPASRCRWEPNVLSINLANTFHPSPVAAQHRRPSSAADADFPKNLPKVHKLQSGSGGLDVP